MLAACDCTTYTRDTQGYCTCGHSFDEHDLRTSECTGEVETHRDSGVRPTKPVKYIKRTMETRSQ